MYLTNQHKFSSHFKQTNTHWSKIIMSNNPKNTIISILSQISWNYSNFSKMYFEVMNRPSKIIGLDLDGHTVGGTSGLDVHSGGTWLHARKWIAVNVGASLLCVFFSPSTSVVSSTGVDVGRSTGLNFRSPFLKISL